jgi:DNA repair protein RadC
MKKYKSTINLISLKLEHSEFLKTKITCSKDTADYVRQFYFDDLQIYESMFLVLLNRANITIGYVKISQGGITGTVVDVRIIAKYAIEALASSVIICHNHPSGNTQPSDADKRITLQIKETLKIFDCAILDHIILTADSYLSMADEGLLF